MDGLEDDVRPVSVVLPDEPPRRRTSLIVGVTVALVAVVAAGVVLLTRSGDDDDSYSLRRAVTAASEMEQISYLVTSEAMGEEVEIDVVADVARQRSRITVNAGAFMDDLEMIVDMEGQVFYMSTESFEDMGIDVETPWISLDEDFAKETGLGSIFTDAAGNEVVNATDLFDDAVSVEDLGLEEIDGEQLRRYRVVVDADDALAASPGAGEQIELAGGDVPEQIIYDMWVSADDELRRIAADIDVGPGIVSTLIVVRTLDEPIDIELPAPDDVTDAADLL